jgi:hypothetical protein
MEIYTLVRGEKIKLDVENPETMITCIGFIYNSDDNLYYKHLSIRKVINPITDIWKENTIPLYYEFTDKKKCKQYIRERVTFIINKHNRVTISLDKTVPNMWKDILGDKYNKDIFKEVKLVVCTPEEYYERR